MSKRKFERLVVAVNQAAKVANEVEQDMAYIAKDLFGAQAESYQEAIREVSEMSDSHRLTLMGMQRA